MHSRRVGRRQGAAVPAAPRRRGLPRTACALVVRRGPRRGRSAARRADLPGVLRLRARGAVERARARAVAAHGDPDPARARAADSASRSGSCASACACPTSRSPSTSAAARCTSTCVVRLDARQPKDARAGRGAAGASSRRELLDRRGRARPRGTRRSSPPRPTDDGRLPGIAPARGARDPLGRAGRGARARHARRRRGVVRRLHRQVRDQVHRGGRRADVPARRPATSSGCGCARTSRGWSSARGGSAAQPHLRELRLRRWAHALGFRGHCFTKSRRYSTTFTAAAPGAPRARRCARHGGRRDRGAGESARSQRELGASRGVGLPDARGRVAGRVGPQAGARAAAGRARGASHSTGAAQEADDGGWLSEQDDGAGERYITAREVARAGRALAGHDPALLPRGPIPGRRMPGQIRPVRFLWSEVEAALGPPTRQLTRRAEWTDRWTAA